MLYLNRKPVDSLDLLIKASLCDKKKEDKNDYNKEWVFKMPPGAYYWSADNQKIMVRNTQSIPCHYSMPQYEDKKFKGTSELRYALTVTPVPANPQVTNFAPDFITIPVTGHIRTKVEEAEKNFFLVNSPYNLSNPARPLNAPIMFETHDKEIVAREKLGKAVDRANAISLIVGNMQLDTESLRKIAFVYWHNDAAMYSFFTSPADMGDDELRLHMHTLAGADPGKFLKFFQQTASDLKLMVNKATTKKILILDSAERRWLMKNEQGVSELVYQLAKDEEAGYGLMNFLEKKDTKGIAQAIAKRIENIEMFVK